MSGIDIHISASSLTLFPILTTVVLLTYIYYLHTRLSHYHTLITNLRQTTAALRSDKLFLIKNHVLEQEERELRDLERERARGRDRRPSIGVAKGDQRTEEWVKTGEKVDLFHVSLAALPPPRSPFPRSPNPPPNTLPTLQIPSATSPIPPHSISFTPAHSPIPYGLSHSSPHPHSCSPALHVPHTSHPIRPSIPSFAAPSPAATSPSPPQHCRATTFPPLSSNPHRRSTSCSETSTLTTSTEFSSNGSGSTLTASLLQSPTEGRVSALGVGVWTGHTGVRKAVSEAGDDIGERDMRNVLQAVSPNASMKVRDKAFKEALEDIQDQWRVAESEMRDESMDYIIRDWEHEASFVT